MSDNQIPRNFAPRDYQLPVFQAMDGGKTRAFLRWHRRAGKDKACFAYMAKEMWRKVGAYYYIFPTYSQGRKALWENTDNDGFKLLNHFPKELVKRINNQEMLIEATNGSIFRVVGSDNIDSIRGTNPVGMVLSEYAFQDPEAWKVMSPILAMNGGWAIFNSTPQGRNHFYQLEQALMKNNPEAWYVSILQGMWPDRENYNHMLHEPNGKWPGLPAIIQAERDAGKDEQSLEVEYGVSYAAGVKGTFYLDQIEKAKSEGRIGNYTYDDHREVDTFWDLGKSDSTSVWFRQIDGNRKVWIDYFEADGKDVAFYVDMLKDKGYRYRTHYLPHDAEQNRLGSTVTTAEIFRHCLREAGISDDVVIPHNAEGKIIRPRIMDGINTVRARFSNYYFDEGKCHEGIVKLGDYHRRWDPKRQVFMNEPVHDSNSHCADALRMEGIVEELSSDLTEFTQSNTFDMRDYDLFG